MKKVKLPVKLNPYEYDNGFQAWVKRITLYDDTQLGKVDDTTLGFYVCEQCGAAKPFCYKLPPEFVCYEHPDGCTDKNHENQRYKNNAPLKEAHNQWLDFLRTHAHGDGRVALFERNI